VSSRGALALDITHTVAALCRQHGVRALWSTDRDFSRFAGLAVVNPLVGDRSM
jgi:predicted nucleic acid-binding protein